MIIKQLSVFLENRVGRLEEVAEILANNAVDIAALSLADTSDYGLLRLIVSNAEAGKQALKEAGISAMTSDVICVKLSNKQGMLYKLLKILGDDNISVEYMYAFGAGEDASIVMKLSDLQKAIDVLKGTELEVLSASEAYREISKVQGD